MLFRLHYLLRTSTMNDNSNSPTTSASLEGQTGQQAIGQADRGGGSDLSSIGTIIGLLRPLSARDRLQVMKAVGGVFNLSVLPTGSVQPARRAEKPASKPQTKAQKPEKKKVVAQYPPIDNEEYKALVPQMQRISRLIAEEAKSVGARLPPSHHLVIERERLKARADAIRNAETAK